MFVKSKIDRFNINIVMRTKCLMTTKRSTYSSLTLNMHVLNFFDATKQLFAH